MFKKNFESGFMLIDKPIDWTSNDAVQFIKRYFNFSKVGHAGTLDPKATGLLILGINDYTKNLSNILHANKKYNVSMKFHCSSSTYDQDANEIFLYHQEQKVTFNQIKDILDNFIIKKTYNQIPPLFSALKINGRKSYELARNNIQIELKPRAVEIFSIEEIKFDENRQILNFSLTCSSGFYVRSFIVDIAKQLNIHAVLLALRRIQINNFHINNALKIDALKTNYKFKNPEELKVLLDLYLLH